MRFLEFIVLACMLERYNGIIWSAVRLAFASCKLAVTQWECVLPDALHSIRSLLCTATNATPHERLFNYKRRSSFGASVPTWLSSLGPEFLRRHARSKYEPLVEEVELVLHATPNYARIRLSTGRETTVPLRDIAQMKRAPAPLFDAANQRDVALSEGPSLEPENLNSDHAIFSDDQQAPCEDTSDNVVRGRNDRGTLLSDQRAVGCVQKPPHHFSQTLHPLRMFKSVFRDSSLYPKKLSLFRLLRLISVSSDRNG